MCTGGTDSAPEMCGMKERWRWAKLSELSGRPAVRLPARQWCHGRSPRPEASVVQRCGRPRWCCRPLSLCFMQSVVRVARNSKQRQLAPLNNRSRAALLLRGRMLRWAGQTRLAGEAVPGTTAPGMPWTLYRQIRIALDSIEGGGQRASRTRSLDVMDFRDDQSCRQSLTGTHTPAVCSLQAENTAFAAHHHLSSYWVFQCSMIKGSCTRTIHRYRLVPYLLCFEGRADYRLKLPHEDAD